MLDLCISAGLCRCGAGLGCPQALEAQSGSCRGAALGPVLVSFPCPVSVWGRTGSQGREAVLGIASGVLGKGESTRDSGL